MLEKTFLFISLAFALFMGTALGTTILGVTQTITVSMLPFCIYIANDLEDAYQLAIDVMHKQLSHIMHPHFEEQYYNKLKLLFEC